MSLFGGSAPPSRSSPESDTSESSSTRSSPSVVEIPDPHNTQETRAVNIPVPLNVNDDLDTDTGSEEDESGLGGDEEDDEEFVRPNRFGGEPKTWRTYTEADRRIVESLEQMESSDLSAHLYNAHAMRRRLQRPVHEIAQLKNWYGRDAWLKSEEELKYTDAAGIVQEDMVPPNDWTAWPVPPTELPNNSKNLDDDDLESDQADEWILGNAGKQAASEELREELLAVFLRIAKDNWNARDASSSVSDAESDSRTSRSRSRSRSVKSTPSRSTSHATSRTKYYSGADAEGTGSGTSEKQDSAPGKRRGRKPQPDVFSKPVVLADDTRAQQLLQPTIQSMMTKLDELALAIYRTRLNHLGLGESGDSSMSEFTSGAESSGSASRSSSRAASRLASRAASRSTSRASSRVTSRASSRAPSEKAISRSPSVRSSRASSAQAIRSIRQGMRDGDVDTMNSDAIYDDSSEWESVIETPRRRKRRRSSDSKSGSDTSTIQGGKFREVSLDWSEILGTAAVKGWDPGAVARTAQRCAALFGESMSFVPLTESVASKPVSKPVWYTPSTIPAPSILSTTESPTSKRPLFQSGTLSCPHPDCEDYKRKFASTSRVIEHCTSVHGYDPRTNDSENEERMAGGVHIDGFLQPIMLKPGWVNDSKAKTKDTGKKQIKVEGNSQPASDAVLSPTSEYMAVS